MAKPTRKPNYGTWSLDELRRAERTAGAFLRQNSTDISEAFRAKLRYLEILVTRLERKPLGLDERLEHFAQISELAQMIKDESDGFFELGSQPVVARVLSGTKRGIR
jgi:hypothetical protein